MIRNSGGNNFDFVVARYINIIYCTHNNRNQSGSRGNGTECEHRNIRNRGEENRKWNSGAAR